MLSKSGYSGRTSVFVRRKHCECNWERWLQGVSKHLCLVIEKRFILRPSDSGSTTSCPGDVIAWSWSGVAQWVEHMTSRVDLHTSHVEFPQSRSKRQSASWHRMWAYLCRAPLDPQLASLANCPGISSLKISRGSGWGWAQWDIGMERFMWLQVWGKGCQKTLSSLEILETLESAEGEESRFLFYYL